MIFKLLGEEFWVDICVDGCRDVADKRGDGAEENKQIFFEIGHVYVENAYVNTPNKKLWKVTIVRLIIN